MIPDFDWKLYSNSHEAWEAMYADCEKAKESIDYETYIFTVDEIGQRFIDLFIKKSLEGVRVRILLDMVGSYGLYISRLPEELQRSGVEVRFFNPVSPWRITNFTSNFFRMHNKMLVVDHNIVHTGGVNIRDDMRSWRDSNVRLQGELAEEATFIFARMWRIIEQGKFLPFKKTSIYVKNFAFSTNAPHLRQRFIYNELVEAIRNAKKYVYLTTPYFVPDIRLLRVIRLAARRGVDVRILLPLVSNYKSIDVAAQSYFTLLLKSGVKIYRYKDPMLHAKTAVIDREWSTIGSFNLDGQSLLFNYELNVVSHSEEFAFELQEIFMKDLQKAHPVLANEWYGRSILRKFVEGVTWPIHKFL
jgi:cardiolipin synthase A/B